jgi:hypothetical protein
LESIHNALQAVAEKMDEDDDAELSALSADTAHLHFHDQSYQHIFKTLTHAIRWPGFDFRRAERGLFDLLKPICSRYLAEDPESVAAACTAASSYFVRFADRVPSAEALALLCELNAAIAERAGGWEVGSCCCILKSLRPRADVRSSRPRIRPAPFIP